MTDERQGKNKGIAISSFDADAEKQSRQAIDRKVLNSQNCRNFQHVVETFVSSDEGRCELNGVCCISLD